VKLETVQSAVALGCVMRCVMGCVLSLAPPLRAATPAIGTAVTQGSFRVDDSTVAGNATLFEGATIETRQSSSSLDLASGPRLLLGADSKGRIFGDRLVLERGSGEMHDAAGFRIETRGLTVRTETGRSAARIVLAGSTRVQVAALAGGLRVLNSHGLLVAELNPGAALEFEPQLAGNASAEQEKFTGCLRAGGGHYLLTDEITNVTVELAGSGLDKENGNHMQVTGVMDPTGAPVSGATQYVRVSTLKRLGRGCPADKAAAAGAGGNPNSPGNSSGAGAGKAAGLSVTALAIIGGVAAAAIVGGLAAGSAFSGSSAAPLSR
jgi:hypothetical protein